MKERRDKSTAGETHLQIIKGKIIPKFLLPFPIRHMAEELERLKKSHGSLKKIVKDNLIQGEKGTGSNSGGSFEEFTEVEITSKPLPTILKEINDKSQHADTNASAAQETSRKAKEAAEEAQKIAKAAQEAVLAAKEGIKTSEEAAKKAAEEAKKVKIDTINIAKEASRHSDLSTAGAGKSETEANRAEAAAKQADISRRDASGSAIIAETSNREAQEAAEKAKEEAAKKKKLSTPARWIIGGCIFIVAAVAAGAYFYPKNGEDNPAPTTTTTSEPPTETPTTETLAYTLNIDLGGGKQIRTTNILSKIKQSTVDVAKGPFKNTIGGGTEAWIAEPGVVMYGPGLVADPEGWDAVGKSKGAMQAINPANQEVLMFEGPAFQNLLEGGFILDTCAKATFKIGDTVIDLPAIENNNYIIVIRGNYGDNKQNTDRNITVKISGYFPGHIQTNTYSALEDSNAAFISEGQFKQIAETSHSMGNSGDGGASMLTFVMYDVNSGAFDVIRQEKGRFQDTENGWNFIFSNFDTEPVK